MKLLEEFNKVKAENKKEVKKVNTGDTTNIVGITLLLVGSLIVLIYLLTNLLLLIC